MKSIISLFSLLALLLVFSSCSSSKSAATAKWELLGERLVDKAGDHDEIAVTAAEGTFRAVKFKILRSPIYVKNVRIVFGNGESQNFQVDRRIPANSESKRLDLNGNQRVIKKIVFNYRTAQRPGPQAKALIKAFGMH